MTTIYSPLSLTQAGEDRIEVTITYLEQTERPLLAKPVAPARKTALMRVTRPPVHFYRYLYDLIGAPYNWVSRRKLNDDELMEIIEHDDNYLYVFYVDGAPAGMAEIDARSRDEYELKFFGLAPDFVGGGFGRFFFTNVIDLAWSRNPKKLKLETCTLDHPAALPFYQKLGFVVVDRRNGIVECLPEFRARTKNRS